MKEMIKEKCKWCMYEDVFTGGCMCEGNESDNEDLGGEDCNSYHKHTADKYGMLRREYIKENYPFEYEELVLRDEMKELLVATNKLASQTLHQMMEQQLKKEPIPAGAGFMETVRHRERIKSECEGTILNEIVYIRPIITLPN